MSDTYYPPVAFSFEVSIATPGNPHGAPVATIFQEVSGIATAIDLEEVSEGGENTFAHRLPAPPKHANLVLKRGIAKASSPLFAWVAAAVNGTFATPADPRTLLVNLVDGSALPLVSWIFLDAWPVRWEVSSFDATGNDIVTESLELAYTSVERSVP